MKKIILFIFFTFALNAEPVQIIFINGPSSAGKSTLAHALQQELNQPFLHIGIDWMIQTMPDKINNWEGGPAPEGFSWKQSKDDSGHLVQNIQIGPFAWKIIKSFREVAQTLAKANQYLIIDDVSFGKENMDAWHEVLKDYKVLWVGIVTPLHVLEEREKARGDRLQGAARAQYNIVHQGVKYDLEIDTSEPTEKTVKKIVEASQL